MAQPPQRARGESGVRSRENDLSSRARFSTIAARAFVAYPEADSLVAIFARGLGKTSTLNRTPEAAEKLEGVSIRYGATLPRGSASFVATRGRLLGRDDRAKAGAFA